MTTDEENELICEKLLGWKLAGRDRFENKKWLFLPQSLEGDQWRTTTTPSFTTWADAGLILEAIAKTTAGVYVAFMGHAWAVHIGFGQQWLGSSGPLAVRAAALEYIKAVKS